MELVSVSRAVTSPRCQSLCIAQLCDATNVHRRCLSIASYSARRSGITRASITHALTLLQLILLCSLMPLFTDIWLNRLHSIHATRWRNELYAYRRLFMYPCDQHSRDNHSFVTIATLSSMFLSPGASPGRGSPRGPGTQPKSSTAMKFTQIRRFRGDMVHWQQHCPGHGHGLKYRLPLKYLGTEPKKPGYAPRLMHACYGVIISSSFV